MKEIEGGHSSGCCLTCRLSAEASLMIRERWIIFDSWASWKEGKKTDCISKIKMKLFFKAVFFSTKLIFYIIRSIINITYQNCHQQKKTLLFQVHHRWNPEKSSSTNSEVCLHGQLWPYWGCNSYRIDKKPIQILSVPSSCHYVLHQYKCWETQIRCCNATRILLKKQIIRY